MALLTRVPRSHSVAGFRQAARLRFAEANRAVEAGDRLIGIYLSGYAAEMILKATYFRIAGRSPTDPISMQDLLMARSYAKTTLGINWLGSLHDLVRWAELVVGERNRRGTSFSIAFASRFSTEVVQIASNWREDLRYHSNRPRPAELAATSQAVQWLFDNELRLIR